MAAVLGGTGGGQVIEQTKEIADPRPGFAERLRMLRDAAGLSVRDLALASARTPRRRHGEPPLRLKRSTIDGMTSRSRPVRPEQAHVEVFIDTCLRVAAEAGRVLPDDLRDRAAWDDAYRDLLTRMAGLRSANRLAAQAARQLADPASPVSTPARPTTRDPALRMAAGRGLPPRPVEPIGPIGPIGPVTAPGPAGFVGRSRALHDLHQVLAQVHAGQPRVALLEGPAGIGKTALVRHLLAHARVGAVVWSSGEEDEADLAFGVFDQMTAEARRILAQRGPGEGDLGEGDRGAGAPAARPRLTDPLPAGSQLIDLLGELQRAGTVVVVVDDLHWADRPSLQALTFAVRRLRVDRVLTLVTVRDLAEAELPGGLVRLLTDEGTLRVSLEGLDEGELRELIAAPGRAGLSWQACARLRAHTGGNPLHARTLLAQVPTEVLEDPDATLPVPRSFALLIVARLADMPAAGRELARAASVLGTHTTLARAAALAGIAQPLGALEQAVTAGLLVEQPTGRALRFTHPLVQAAVYEQAGPVRRAELHTRAAELTDDEASRLHHLARAASGPDERLAGRLAGAGRRQAMAGAWAGAARQLSTAAGLSPSRADYEQLTLEAADCHLLAGALRDPAATAAEIDGFRRTAWRDYLRARLAFQRGEVDETERLLRSAWACCDPDAGPEADAALGARVAGWLAALYSTQRRDAPSAEWASRALALDPGLAGFDLIWMMWLVGLAQSGSMDEMLAFVRDLPDPAGASVADLDLLVGRSRLYVQVDRVADACHDLSHVLTAGRDRSLIFRVVVTAMLAEAEHRAGRWDDSAIHGALAMSLMSDFDYPTLIPFCHQVAVLVPAARGQWALAESHVNAAQSFAQGLPGFPDAVACAAIATAHLARARDRPADVVAALEPAVRSGLLDLSAEPGTSGWQGILVDALVALDELTRAEEMLGPYERGAARRGRRSSMVAAARARGNLEARRGDRDRAACSFHAALATVCPLDLPFEQALVHLDFGTFLHQAGRASEAIDQLRAAHHTFALLDAVPFLERSERELTACGHPSTIICAVRATSSESHTRRALPTG